MGPKFGTSGLRGLATELVGSVSALYATAFSRMLFDRGRVARGATVLVGRDFRDSSSEIAAICMAALARAGMVPVDCGGLPTPALALYGRKLGAASLMITGSHIPADRNGIKFYLPDGEINKADEQAITALAEQLSADADATRVECGRGADHSSEATDFYIQRYETLLPKSGLQGLKIGLYQHSSVARDILTTILEGHGANVVPVGRSEVFIPVDTEAISAATCKMLAAWAKEFAFDAIVSSDADADRPLLTDETGTPLRGDLLGLICARLLEAKLIATPITSNSGIEAASGVEVVRTRVGSPYVIAAMTEAVARGKQRVMGFEANGGVMLGSNFSFGGASLPALPTRDCVLPIIAALHMAVEAKTPLSGIVAMHRLPVALSGRIENYPFDRSDALVAFLKASKANVSHLFSRIGRVTGTDDVDGLRLTFEGGRILHIRPSGNAPELRCYVEADDPDAAEHLLAQGLAVLNS
ncbi:MULTISPECIES: phosphomannomutase [Sinorhizobium/Ensifer group]|uniref:Phosphomannomutase n=4 Tax=Sinorhizobium TaxID=28105 RepID=A0A844A7P9_RHIFR|nr:MULTISPECIES: phosphomannomutase [Sinorhizobium]MCK3780908.1 phosphomannomutase [Ensifer sesbaniae]ASY60893.1 Phosphomannomutase [Sinorhizobium sp. CCBAU 05631]ASY67336.1 Phosphomannomutase [Sinorhizobium sojae CCBAU 05684]ASY74063.1 Phosphomannomutase [Sinorhizobium fredii CCBAU 83666]AWM29966.1 Phosphomannomutase [Sinorhizobium fredii CCBAU 25509]